MFFQNPKVPMAIAGIVVPRAVIVIPKNPPVVIMLSDAVSVVQ